FHHPTWGDSLSDSKRLIETQSDCLFNEPPGSPANCLASKTLAIRDVSSNTSLTLHLTEFYHIHFAQTRLGQFNISRYILKAKPVPAKP
ncbi:MAG: hypothetical protein V3V52_08945, partial [Candidatus Adiutricales bacterium]